MVNPVHGDEAVASPARGRSLRSRWDLVIVFVATMAVGAFTASRSTLGLDEAVTFAIVDRPFGAFTRVLSTEGVGMAPYYAGLWFWSQLGTSDWWIKMFSVLGGAVAVGLLFVLAQRWVGRLGAFVACAITLSSPFFLRYLVNVRAYSWLMAVAVLNVLVADRLLRDHKRSTAVMFGVVVGLGLVSHALYITIVGGIVIALFASRSVSREIFSRLVLAGVVALAVAAPVLVLAVSRQGELEQFAPATPFRFVAVTSSALGSLPTSPIIVVGIGLLLINAIVKRRDDWPTVCLLSLSIAPPLLLALLSQFNDGVYNSRYLAPFFPFAAAAAVLGYMRVWPARRAVVALAVGGACVLVGLVGPARDDGDAVDATAVSAVLRAKVRPNDVVVFLPSYSRVLVGRYWGYHADVDRMMIRREASKAYPTTRALSAIRADLRRAPAVWLVTLGSPTRPTELRDFRVISRESFGALHVTQLASATG